MSQPTSSPLDILPAPRPPFMVKDTFVVKADLFPLGNVYNGHREERHFAVDAELPRFVRAKLASLREAAERHHVRATDDPAGLVEALWRILGLYAAEWPQLLLVSEPDLVDLRLHGIRLDGRLDRSAPTIERLPGLTPLGAEVAAWLDGRTGIDRLADALALSCQEDLVLMCGFPDGSDVAEWLHVCVPSGWDPAEKVGRSFQEIHVPVADNARLVASGPNVVKAMIGKGPYVRFGWGLTTNPDLNGHPARRPASAASPGKTPAEVAALTYLRMERQTTLAMPDLARSLFTVRISLDPLVDRLAAEPALRPRLASLLASCTPDVIAYKGMSDLAAPILAWLEEPDHPGG